ncbi:MAG: hypothetical protein M1820_007597 [Bogoriella megaspora]|nr:MAG: hypothetical protein M1820_007597 [Bogoriella megaspora]
MNFVASHYSPLSSRSKIPVLYQPFTFLLTLLPFLVPSRSRQIVILFTFPLLLTLCLYSPNYTFGDHSSDYYSSGPFLAMLLWYFDFVICTPSDGPGAPNFIDSAATSSQVKDGREDEVQAKSKRLEDCRSTWERLRWAFRLMIPCHRGIGWNWQVKGVPPDPYAWLPKWEYVGKHLGWAVLVYLRSAVMLVGMGFGSQMQFERSTSASGNWTWEYMIWDAVIGWSGATWVWDRLCCAYSFAAALSVAIGLSEVWEWPPLMGDLREAWSVRQMWSSAYHQVLRRMVSQPAIRTTRFLGLRKGSVASRYTQLYLSFAISCLYHEFEIFSVTRRDMGEFAFFLSQPVAITAEDIVQWIWRKLQPDQEPSPTSVACAKMIGYSWVFAWFSWSLPIYLKGLRDADIIRDAILGSRPFEAMHDMGLQILYLDRLGMIEGELDTATGQLGE